MYNENIRDLMNPSNEEVMIQEDPIKGVIASGITELVAQSSEEVPFMFPLEVLCDFFSKEQRLTFLCVSFCVVYR